MDADEQEPPVSQELKPCPFCAGEPVWPTPRSNGAYWQIVCSAEGCGASLNGDTKELTVMEWNHRPDSRQLYEALVGLLERFNPLVPHRKNHPVSIARAAIRVYESRGTKGGQDGR